MSLELDAMVPHHNIDPYYDRLFCVNYCKLEIQKIRCALILSTSRAAIFVCKSVFVIDPLVRSNGSVGSPFCFFCFGVRERRCQWKGHFGTHDYKLA